MFLLKQLTHRMVIQYHHQIGHLFVPNLKARIPNEDGGFYIRTNSQGFRSNIEFSTKRGSRPRILFFGDSYTAGDNCENSERFSDKVGEILNAEVFNYGLSGSGTDQHCLIYEHFARHVEADLIVLCVQVDSIKRIQVSHRASIDRITGQKVLVPKPYFRLENGVLALSNVPVPLKRPEAETHAPNSLSADEWQYGLFDLLLNMYRTDSRLSQLRRVIRSNFQRLQSEVYKKSGTHP